MLEIPVQSITNVVGTTPTLEIVLGTVGPRHYRLQTHHEEGQSKN